MSKTHRFHHQPLSLQTCSLKMNSKEKLDTCRTCLTCKNFADTANVYGTCYIRPYLYSEVTENDTCEHYEPVDQ